MRSPRVGNKDREEKGTKIDPWAFPELTCQEMRGMHTGT